MGWRGDEEAPQRVVKDERVRVYRGGGEGHSRQRGQRQRETTSLFGEAAGNMIWPECRERS